MWAAHLDAGGDVVDDPDGFGVGVTREGMGDEVKLHLPGGLRARLLPVDGLAGGALQAAVLRGHTGWAWGPTGAQPCATHPERVTRPPWCPQAGLTLLPLLYMATRHSRWYMCPHLPSLPTSSGLMPRWLRTPS